MIENGPSHSADVTPKVHATCCTTNKFGNCQCLHDHTFSKPLPVSLVASTGPHDSTCLSSIKGQCPPGKGLANHSCSCPRSLGQHWSRYFSTIYRWCEKQQLDGSLGHWPEPGFHLCYQCVQKSDIAMVIW